MTNALGLRGGSSSGRRWVMDEEESAGWVGGGMLRR